MTARRATLHVYIQDKTPGSAWCHHITLETRSEVEWERDDLKAQGYRVKVVRGERRTQANVRLHMPK